MNERTIVIGQDKDGESFYAMYANDATIYTGDTPEDAVKRLLTKRHPMIWYPFEATTINGLGSLAAEFINQETKELTVEYPRYCLRKIKDALKGLTEQQAKSVLEKLEV